MIEEIKIVWRGIRWYEVWDSCVDCYYNVMIWGCYYKYNQNNNRDDTDGDVRSGFHSLVCKIV